MTGENIDDEVLAFSNDSEEDKEESDKESGEIQEAADGAPV